MDLRADRASRGPEVLWGHQVLQVRGDSREALEREALSDSQDSLVRRDLPEPLVNEGEMEMMADQDQMVSLALRADLVAPVRWDQEDRLVALEQLDQLDRLVLLEALDLPVPLAQPVQRAMTGELERLVRLEALAYRDQLGQ